MDKQVERRSFPIQATCNVLIILLLITAVGVIAAFYSDRPITSEIEKRELVKRPEFSAALLVDGQYTKQFSAYFADTFPAREQLVKLASVIKENRGFKLGEMQIYSTVSEEAILGAQMLANATQSSAVLTLPMPIAPTENTQAQGEVPEQSGVAASGSSTSAESSVKNESDQSAESQRPPVAESETPAAPALSPVLPSVSTMVDTVDEGVRMGAIFIYKDSGYTIFGGSDQMGQWYAQVINAYQKVLGDHIQIYNLVVPTAIEFYLPPKYKGATATQKPKLDNIEATLEPAIKWVNVYETMAAHKDEYLYYRTDHHWSTLGAYYAYEQFAKAAGFAPLPLSSMEKRTLPNFLGTLYSQTQNSKMAGNPDYVDYFIMPTSYRCYQFRKGFPDTAVRVPLYGEYAKSYNSYSVFLHGDFPVTVIETENHNDKRIAVVKESYGNAFVPFLVNHYESIVVIDQRYLEKGFYDLLDEYRINELLFINNIAAAHTAVRIQELASLPTRTYIPPQVEAEKVSEDAPQDAASEQPREKS